MNTDISEIENEFNQSPPKKEKPPRSGGALAFLALLLSLAALAAAGWLWWQGQSSPDGDDVLQAEVTRLDAANREMSADLQKMRDRFASLSATDSSAAIGALESRLNSETAGLEQINRTLAEQTALTRSVQMATEAMQSRLLAAEAAISGLSVTGLDADKDLDLAEVDYLLRLANERLQLFLDPASADRALELADIHLEALNNPMYLGVRQEIAASRRALAAVALPDDFQISNEIDAIQASLDGLHFHDEVQSPEAAPAESGEQGWWAKLKGVFAGLVTVRRSTELENERISLEDRDYVRQRLWLQMEIARLSLMRHDQASFRRALEQVEKALSEWFDVSDPQYQSVLKRLAGLQDLQIEVAMPEINQPWSTLRLLRSGHARPAAPPAEAPPSETDAASPAVAADSEQVQAESAPEPAAEEPPSTDAEADTEEMDTQETDSVDTAAVEETQ